MTPYTLNSNKLLFKQIRRNISLVILVAFVTTSVKAPAYAQAVPTGLPYMSQPGVMVHLSPEFTPAHLKGIVIHPENALKFDFIVYKGDQEFTEAQKKEEYTKLTKYFLASLAIPDEDQWVNLSPYEKDRIIKDDFGKTEMGRDLLAQDYMLKQITASLIYPEDNLGKKFWERVYAQAQEQFHTSNIPVNTFNKVWILPDDAVIYEKGNTAYVLKNHLKVMLEEDYLALDKHSGIQSTPKDNKTHSVASKVVREIVLPELEKEVNEGKNFAALRQVYSGMLLAAWYKRALKESLLSKIYANQSKTKGVDSDPKANEAIYQQYLKAYKKGVFNFIKEDVDRLTNETIPRKYFSGGARNILSNAEAKQLGVSGLKRITFVNSGDMLQIESRVNGLVVVSVVAEESQAAADAQAAMVTPANAAMTNQEEEIFTEFGIQTIQGWEPLKDETIIDRVLKDMKAKISSKGILGRESSDFLKMARSMIRIKSGPYTGQSYTYTYNIWFETAPSLKENELTDIHIEKLQNLFTKFGSQFLTQSSPKEQNVIIESALRKFSELMQNERVPVAWRDVFLKRARSSVMYTGVHTGQSYLITKKVWFDAKFLATNGLSLTGERVVRAATLKEAAMVTPASSAMTNFRKNLAIRDQGISAQKDALVILGNNNIEQFLLPGLVTENKSKIRTMLELVSSYIKSPEINLSLKKSMEELEKVLGTIFKELNPNGVDEEKISAAQAELEKIAFPTDEEMRDVPVEDFALTALMPRSEAVMETANALAKELNEQGNMVIRGESAIQPFLVEKASQMINRNGLADIISPMDVVALLDRKNIERSPISKDDFEVTFTVNVGKNGYQDLLRSKVTSLVTSMDSLITPSFIRNGETVFVPEYATLVGLWSSDEYKLFLRAVEADGIYGREVEAVRAEDDGKRIIGFKIVPLNEASEIVNSHREFIQSLITKREFIQSLITKMEQLEEGDLKRQKNSAAMTTTPILNGFEAYVAMNVAAKMVYMRSGQRDGIDTYNTATVESVVGIIEDILGQLKGKELPDTELASLYFSYDGQRSSSLSSIANHILGEVGLRLGSGTGASDALGNTVYFSEKPSSKKIMNTIKWLGRLKVELMSKKSIMPTKKLDQMKAENDKRLEFGSIIERMRTYYGKEVKLTFPALFDFKTRDKASRKQAVKVIEEYVGSFSAKERKEGDRGAFLEKLSGFANDIEKLDAAMTASAVPASAAMMSDAKDLIKASETSQKSVAQQIIGQMEKKQRRTIDGDGEMMMLTVGQISTLARSLMFKDINLIDAGYDNRVENIKLFDALFLDENGNPEPRRDPNDITSYGLLIKFSSRQNDLVATYNDNQKKQKNSLKRWGLIATAAATLAGAVAAFKSHNAKVLEQENIRFYKDMDQRIELLLKQDKIEQSERPVSEKAALSKEPDVGGIDFNAANLNLQIKRDGKGVPLPISMQSIENIHIDGLIPVIIDIKPAMQTPLLSQLQAGKEPEVLAKV